MRLNLLSSLSGMGCLGGKNYKGGASSRHGSLNLQSQDACAEWIAGVQSTVM